jgi:hypothetical protein
MIAPEVIATLQHKYESFLPYMNERTRRAWAAVEASTLGYGGISAVAKATGLSRNTIAAGMQELQIYQGEPLAKAIPEQIRKPGGGRKRVEEIDPTLLEDLESLVEPTTRGDPQSPLRWSCKSVDKLAEQLKHGTSALCQNGLYLAALNGL